MEFLFIVFIFLAVMLPVFLSLMFIPYWTRKTESFGVSIPEEVFHRSDLKRMRKTYTLWTGVLSAVTTIIFLSMGTMAGGKEDTFSLLFTFILMLFMIVSFLIYLRFHKQMKSLKAQNEWGKGKPQHIIMDTNFRKQKLTYSNAWFIIPFAVALSTVVLTFQYYDRIPEQIPMKYSFDGEVTNWAEKSYRTVMVMPVMQVYLALLFLFINVMIAKAKQQVSAENPEESKYRNQVFRRRWSAFIIITGIAITLLFALIQWSFIFPVSEQILVVVPLLFGIGVTISTIILSFTTGQGGSRVKTSKGHDGQVIDRDDDRYWKLGQFYYNKNDPSLFLEKRFGIGWTINFARPSAWMIFLGIIILAVGIPLLLGV